MITEPPKHDQIDERVPQEIWERIFGRLYPSQLTRMSRVNKNFNKIVSSLSVWSRMYSLTFGPTMPLRTLLSRSESNSYMLYMCAWSLEVCEECFRYGSAFTRPFRALAPLPTLSKDNLIYLGEEINLNWTIMMCQSCYDKKRRRTIENDVGNTKTKNRIRWYREQP